MKESSNLFCKFFCERHTASNAMAQLIIENFDAYVVANDYLGWKHRLAPQRDEWESRVMLSNFGRTNYTNTHFVITVRHPIAWLRAMHREPYCWHQPELKTVNFTTFLDYPIEDFRNPIVMWNEKYRSYIRFLKEIPSGIYLKQEDFASNQAIVYERLKQTLRPKGPFVPMTQYISGEGVGLKKKISKPADLSDYDSTQAAILKSFIDYDVLDYFGYSL